MHPSYKEQKILVHYKRLPTTTRTASTHPAAAVLKYTNCDFTPVQTPQQPTTFHYQDLTIEVDPDVYDPAEDTFLLLQTIHPQPGTSVLELGTGCGIIALACARNGASVVASDINPHAVRNCRRNLKRNQPRLTGTLDVRHGDLFSVLRPDERFDLIVFNPPYVPTPPEETTEDWLDLATSGGDDGLQVTTRFLTDVRDYLTPMGHAYIIVSSHSPQPTLHRCLKEHQLKGTIVGTQRFEDEEISCYRLAPTD